jgi:hypothetical protein
MVHDAADTEMDGTSQRRKKRWSDFSPQQQTAIVLGAIAELIMTTIALGDLARRPARQVSGGKLLWVLACFVQPIGPVLYLVVGRRQSRYSR